MRRILAAAAVLLVAAVAGAWAYAPYLPQLLIEGFPALAYPASGHFAVVAGASQSRRLPGTPAQTPAALLGLFNDSGGKALLVFRGGTLVVEQYGEGISADTPLNSFSMVKSLVGALVYRALAEGRLAGLDVTLGSLLPDLGEASLRPVTVRALLEMRSGIVFHDETRFGGTDGIKDIDGEANPFGPLARLHYLGLEAIEDGLTAQPALDSPFSYQNVNTAILGAVLEAVYGRDLPALLADKIWRPAGAGEAHWRRPSDEAAVSAYCCLYATARDWIRVGLFLAENGGSDPFLPPPLWRQFLGLDLSYEDIRRGHYGEHIRQDVLDRPGEALQGAFTYLMGLDGQVLYVMPERGFVVFRSGDRPQRLHSTLYEAWTATTG